MLAAGWQQALGFALLGPRTDTGGLPATYGDTWQVEVIDYDTPGDVGTPKNIGGSFIGQGYRRNTPVLYYAYNESFSGFFGAQGEQAVDSAFTILNNSFTNNSGLGLDGYTSNLVEFPFDSQSINYTAESLGLTDIKSVALYLMVEEMGLAEPERYAWGLHDRFLPPGGKCPGDELYLVDQRNYGITPSALSQVQYSPYVNNTLYTYEILEICTGNPVLAQTLPIAVDPFAHKYTAVAGMGQGLGRTPDFTSPNGVWASGEVGGFYTGLTVDDVAGLRFLMSTNQIVFEDSAAGSLLEQTNFNLSPLVTQNLGALLQFAQTNPPAALLAAFPNLVINTVSNYYTIVSNPIVFSYFTNYPGSPANTPPVFVIGTNGYFLSFQTNYVYTFDNVVIVDYYSNTPAQKITVSLARSNGAPAGLVYTNTTIQKITLTNFPSGDYFTLPPGSCGFDIVVTNGSNIIPTTNVVTEATNTLSIATGFVGTESIVYDFKQRLFQYYSCSLVTNGPSWYRGIGHIQFVRVPDEYLDSDTGVFIQPYTNTYSMVWYNPTNGQVGTRIFQRIVTSPDIMFNGDDLASPNVAQIGVEFGARTIPNWDLANIIPNEAGPGTINPPVVITYNTVGNIYGNGSLNDNFLTTNSLLSQIDQGGLLSWASFDATTNPPIVYPNGTSIQNLENQLVISVSPTSLPNGTNGVAYPTTTFTATGGQPPYTWSLAGTQVPNGLSFYNGILSGTPVSNPTGPYDFTIQLTDSIGRVVDFSYTIDFP